MGINFGVSVVSAQNAHVAGYQGHYCCSRNYELSDDGVPFAFPTPNERLKTVAINEFKRIPGSPVAYWVSDFERDLYVGGSTVDSVGAPRKGIDTGENAAFLRLWWEVSKGRCSFANSPAVKKWFPYNKGGDFRRWYGNRDYVVNWLSDGSDIKARLTWTKKKPTIRNARHFFQEGFTWTTVSSGWFSIRYTPVGAIFDNGGCTLFCADNSRLNALAALLNSKVAQRYLEFLSPTLNFQPGAIGNIPYRPTSTPQATLSLVGLGRNDWDIYERSWDFQSLPFLTASAEPAPTLESSYTTWVTQNRNIITEMKRLEEENNRLFINAYGLQDELAPDIPIEQITLTVNPAYRYGGKLTEEEQWTRFRKNTMAELVSYAIGCIMGRYSLDAPGLIYAHSGNVGFDASGYTTFPADSDGIVPLTDSEWFDDDAAHRLIEFISVAWDAARLEANLAFLADNLSPKKNESSRETLRRYLCDSFFKDHLQTYKKRPIYWLFSSSKQKAFQCLVYLHRYNEGTLARMRTEYVIPLQGMMASRVRRLEGDIAVAASTTHRRRLEKERETLVKQQSELREFDEKLRHYADQRVSLDLDDGVKVNYGKFGDLLAEVKAVTGAKAD